MTIKIYDASSEETTVFSGTPEDLVVQLDVRYTWLKRYKPTCLPDMIKLLSRQQMLFVSVEEA
jgi:hypothetical protein